MKSYKLEINLGEANCAVSLSDRTEQVGMGVARFRHVALGSRHSAPRFAEPLSVIDSAFLERLSWREASAASALVRTTLERAAHAAVEWTGTETCMLARSLWARRRPDSTSLPAAADAPATCGDSAGLGSGDGD